MRPYRIVVMGVAGSGKTTVAAALAAALGAEHVEADDHHLPASVAKMAAGIPLSDDDRWPWLRRLERALAAATPERPVVVTCSALRRAYRDVLRRPGDVRFVFLDVSRDEAYRRVQGRRGHFMGPAMVDSQLATLEAPHPDETDVVRIVAGTPEQVVAQALEALRAEVPRAVPPLLAEGGVDRSITEDELAAHVHALVAAQILSTGAARVLLVPPDHTRLHSRAGLVAGLLYRALTAAGCHVGVLPALGTHTAMGPHDAALLFGDLVPFDALVHHEWRHGLVRVGEIGAAEVGELSGGRYVEAIPVELDAVLFDGWDLVVSIGQVVPHEVIGLANFTKNLVIGLGGGATVHRSHFVGAVAGMESIMGRADSAVRRIVDAAFDRFVAPLVPVLWVLTVMEDTPAGVVQRGLFAGRGRSSESGGAAYRAAAGLARACNVQLLDERFSTVSCWMDPEEFRSTWLANKAIYRTRMAIADGGELIVLAPGVGRFGEDDAIDVLIRRHGYRGTASTLAAVADDRDLAANLAAAAHLVHGSSEGRFRIVYCTDPASGGLDPQDVESVGYEWRDLRSELVRLGVDAMTPSGPRRAADGTDFHHVANAALGLWADRRLFD